MALELYFLVMLKLGVMRSFPRAFRHAPVVFGGLGLPHSYVEQGVAQLEVLLQHLRADSQTGMIMRATLKQEQL